jgi:hypothetical protein
MTYELNNLLIINKIDFYKSIYFTIKYDHLNFIMNSDFYFNLKNWLKVANPSNCFTPNTELKQIFEELKEGKNDRSTKYYSSVNKGLEKMYIDENIKNHFEYSLIPRPFRFGGFCIVNSFVAFVLLLNPPFLGLGSATRMGVYNLFNRIYCVNLDYFNRAPTEYDLKMARRKEQSKYSILGLQSFMGSFICATIGACSVGYYLEKMLSIHKSKQLLTASTEIGHISPMKIFSHPVLRRGLPPSIALGCGHLFDLFFSRFRELYDGALLYKRNESGHLVKLETKSGEQVQSRLAGFIAVSTTWFQRASTAAFVLISNSLVVCALDKVIWLNTYPNSLVAVKIFSMGVSCYFGLCLTQAYVGPETLKLSERWLDKSKLKENHGLKSIEFYRGN